MHSRESDHLRHWLADRIQNGAVRLAKGAELIRPVYNGPLCPDCRIAPDPGVDAECPTCREHWEYQRQLNEIDRAAYAAGYDAAIDAQERYG